MMISNSHMKVPVLACKLGISVGTVFMVEKYECF
jgi:hypothetical protein